MRTKTKLLLIDDDEDDKLLFCEALGEVAPQISCLTALNGREAVAQLTDLEIELPDLIFLDVNMPIMDGWQCLALLKANPNCQNIPVIMYSTSSYPEDRVKAKRGGALLFFTKPSSFTELKKSLALVVIYLDANALNDLETASPFFS